jgi:glycosyltransferase involved in cell wall biosynthesis
MSGGASLRVAISVPAFLRAPDFGGPVAKVALLAEGLAARGHRVTVLTADYGPNRSTVAAGTVSEAGYTTHYLKTVARYRWSPVLAPRTLSAVAWDFDVVHVCGIRDGLSVAVAERAIHRRTPYVMEPMGMAPARLRNTGLKRVVDRLITRRHLARAASVIATSGLERDRLRDHYALARIDVRPNPLALDPTAPTVKVAHPGDPVDVLFVGRICRTKGLDLLVEAVRPLANVRVTIAGPDDDDGTSAELQRAAATMPDGRVVLRGWVTGDERDRLIAASDICVLPSITENFGNFAVEAARGRRPVVVTNTSGVAGFLGDAALVVDPTVDALRGAIERLAGDPALRDDLGGAGMRRVADLDPATVAAAQEQIYRAAIDAARR